MWIRTSGLSGEQMQAFRRVIDDCDLKIHELKVDFYDGQELQEVINLEYYAAELYLTDSIAYQVYQSESE